MDKNTKNKTTFIPFKRFSLVIWPFLLLIASFIYGFFQEQRRKSNPSFGGFFTVNWRYGLTFEQTIWDVDLFWGELWFNIMVALLLSIYWIKKSPISIKSEISWSKKKIKRIFFFSNLILFLLFITMLITQLPDERLLQNWYPTHTANQLFAWPAIIASLLLLLKPIKSKYNSKETQDYKPKSIILILLSFIIVLWIIMVLPTTWDPHSISNIEIQFHTWLYTLSMPLCITVFILNFQLKNSPEKGDGRKSKVWKSLIMLILALSIIAILQIIVAFDPRGYASDDMFSMWLLWWWPFSHWPGWLLITCLTISIVTGTQLILYKKNLIQENLNPSSNSSDNPSNRKENESSSLDKIKNTIKTHVNRINTRMISSLTLICLFIIPIFPITAYSFDEPLVLVNQVGYYPEGMKHIVFQVPIEDEDIDRLSYNLREKSSNKIVYSGDLTYFGDFYNRKYYDGYFTDFENSGLYYIDVNYKNKIYKSHGFSISDDVYDITFERAVDFFYYQRCGYDVKEIIPGFVGHKACHLDDAMVFNGSDLSQLVYYNLTGGWHDAGDYNKYNSWFFTQWFCVRSLNDAWQADDRNYYSNIDVKYDSNAPDILDEALWGATFLSKCIDRVGLRENTYGMVFKKIVDWDYSNNQSALMGYSGPPDQNTDNIIDSDDERVVWDRGEDRPTWGFAWAEAGFGYAGALMQTARILDEYIANNPDYKLPSWAANTTYMRESADLLNETYYNQDTGTHIYAKISRLFYEQEAAIYSNNFENSNKTADELLNLVYLDGHNWIYSYALARLMEYYLNANFEIPSQVIEASSQRQNLIFEEYYHGPFNVFNGKDEDGNLRLFGRPGLMGHHHGILNSDMFANMYFQVLFSNVAPNEGKLDLLQYELDYLFGINPLGLCQMDGVGGNFLKKIHHRYGYAHYPSGRVPGGIINGIANVQPTRDYYRIQETDLSIEERWLLVPEEAWVDYWDANALVSDGVNSQTNEIWIPHNAIYLEMMSSYYKYFR